MLVVSSSLNSRLLHGKEPCALRIPRRFYEDVKENLREVSELVQHLSLQSVTDSVDRDVSDQHSQATHREMGPAHMQIVTLLNVKDTDDFSGFI